MASEPPAPTSASPDENKTLMGLPVEIRVRIYGHVLQEKAKIRVDIRKRPMGLGGYEIVRKEASYHAQHRGISYDRKTKRLVANTPKKTAILYACHQVYEEAEEVFYGTNHFAFSGPRALTGFVDFIGERSKHLRFVSIEDDHDHSMEKDLVTALESLQVAQGLKTLEFQHWTVCYRVYAEKLAHACKEFLLTLKKAKIAAGKFDSDIVNVLRFELEDCLTCKRGVTNWHRHWQGAVWVPCNCACGDASAQNAKFEAKAKEIVREYIEAAEAEAGNN